MSCRGLIPAHTGKTKREARMLFKARAHPRAYGENPAIWRKLQCLWGSSPRIRGKHEEVEALRRETGLIPAHTGKTSCPEEGQDHQWAHPRAYGENESSPRQEKQRPGSSPRIRGKPGAHLDLFSRPGLIPAHTGKTLRVQVAVRECWAHPRAYGENPCDHTSSTTRAGSSPRIRGKRRRAQGHR